PFKLAILDTRYDESPRAFDIPGRSKKIKKWMDFASGSPNPVDADGHGTHLLTLMLQLDCPASIYVGARSGEQQDTSFG
ncbi:hypothetical protein QBC36DRAFT_199431, partial [Triangularia setosa]